MIRTAILVRWAHFIGSARITFLEIFPLKSEQKNYPLIAIGILKKKRKVPVYTEYFIMIALQSPKKFIILF